MQKKRESFEKLTELRRSNKIVKWQSAEMTILGFFGFFLLMHHFQHLSEGIITDCGIQHRQQQAHFFP
ncbi:MAG: hypothetical protein R6U78_10135 [Bacteroidales bacterium]